MISHTAYGQQVRLPPLGTEASAFAGGNVTLIGRWGWASYFCRHEPPSRVVLAIASALDEKALVVVPSDDVQT